MLQTITLPGGFACEPGYVYAALNFEHINRTKCGKSLNPWTRPRGAYTWEPSAGWGLVHAIVVADRTSAEEHVKRCLLPFAVPHLNEQRNSEHFKLHWTKVVKTLELTAKRQEDAVRALRRMMRAALASGSVLDPLTYLLGLHLGNRNMRLALMQALDGDKTMMRGLSSRGLVTIPAEQLVLFDRRNAAPVFDDPLTQSPEDGPKGHPGRHPFVGSIFAGHWLSVFEGYAGLDRAGRLVSFSELSDNVTAVAMNLNNTSEAVAACG